MSILETLKEERDKFDEAIAILEGNKKVTRKRKPKLLTLAGSSLLTGSVGRNWSAQARARQSKMMKARWAQRKRMAA